MESIIKFFALVLIGSVGCIPIWVLFVVAARKRGRPNIRNLVVKSHAMSGASVVALLFVVFILIVYILGVNGTVELVEKNWATVASVAVSGWLACSALMAYSLVTRREFA